jgi:hypothetical protein
MNRPRTCLFGDLMLRASRGWPYPARTRTRADTFQRAYPQWRQLDALRDPRIMSAFWERVTAS